MNRWVLALALLLVLLALGIAFSWSGNGNGGPEPGPGSGGQGSNTQREALLARGKEILKTEPANKISKEWLDWHNTLSLEDRSAWVLAREELLTPPEPAPMQKQAARVETWGGAGRHFPMKMLTNYKPLLRLDGEISVRPLQIETIVSARGFVSTLWARRAKDSLVVDWVQDKISKGKVDNSRMVGGPVPQYVPPGMFLTSSDKLFYKNGAKSFNVKWDRKSAVFPLVLDEEYSYAFGLERNESVQPKVVDGIVVVDVKNKKVADIVSIPAAPSSVHVVFDPEKGYLLVVESEWKWILLFDLRQSAESTNTQSNGK